MTLAFTIRTIRESEPIIHKKISLTSAYFLPSGEQLWAFVHYSRFDSTAVMAPLEYCQQCRGAAQDIFISGIGDVRRDIFSTPQQRFVLKQCGTCMELRTAFLNKLQRDYFIGCTGPESHRHLGVMDVQNTQVITSSSGRPKVCPWKHGGSCQKHS